MPSHYNEELYNKLQNWKQGQHLTIDKYFKEMDVAMIRLSDFLLDLFSSRDRIKIVSNPI